LRCAIPVQVNVSDRLPRMGLSEQAADFWVAAAAAAPVIALAGLVSIPDAAVAGNILSREKPNYPKVVGTLVGGRQLLAPPNGWIIIYGILNLVVQGFVLIMALLALLDNRPLVAGFWIIVLEGIGLFFLLVAALLAGQVSAVRQQVEEERAKDAAEELAKGIAKEFVRLQLASRLAGDGDGQGEEEA